MNMHITSYPPEFTIFPHMVHVSTREWPHVGKPSHLHIKNCHFDTMIPNTLEP